MLSFSLESCWKLIKCQSTRCFPPNQNLYSRSRVSLLLPCSALSEWAPTSRLQPRLRSRWVCRKCWRWGTWSWLWCGLKLCTRKFEEPTLVWSHWVAHRKMSHQIESTQHGHLCLHLFLWSKKFRSMMCKKSFHLLWFCDTVQVWIFAEKLTWISGARF